MDKNKAKEMWPIIKAFSEGENVEYFNGFIWSRIEYGATFESDFNNYRIKPQPKLVPFTFEDNLLFKDKWFKYKDGAFRRSLRLVAYEGDCVTVHNRSFSYQKFLDDYVFEDGYPCGKYINE